MVCRIGWTPTIGGRRHYFQEKRSAAVGIRLDKRVQRRLRNYDGVYSLSINDAMTLREHSAHYLNLGLFFRLYDLLAILGEKVYVLISVGKPGSTERFGEWVAYIPNISKG